MAGIEEPVDQLDNVQPQAQIPIPAAQNNNIPDPLLQATQPRARRTYKDDLISSLLSKLSLREKLSKNKEIEDQNKNRNLKNYNLLTDPLAHPEPGSENASFPTLKSNPLPGETKGQFILNIADMTKRTKDCKSFGDELSLDFGEWSEAAQNCFRFHQLQDWDGDMGPYATW